MQSGPEENIPKRVDVVIVGAGIAGCVAALRAREAGCLTLMLDKADEISSTSNAVLSQGILHIGRCNIGAPTEEIERSVAGRLQGFSHPEVVAALINSRKHVAEWLGGHKVNIREVPSIPGEPSFLSPFLPLSHYRSWQGRGPDVALRLLRAKFEGLGGLILAGATATELLPKRDGFGVGGILVRHRGKLKSIEAGAVFLADGGFQANRAMVSMHIGRFADQCKLRANVGGTGDGIRMVEQYRGKLVNLPYFYGHLLHRAALTDDRLWPRPKLDKLLPFGILTDAEGLRFVDEGLGGIAATNAAARLDRPRDIWFVTDHDGWLASKPDLSKLREDTGIEGELETNVDVEVELGKRDAAIHRVSSIPELANATGLDVARLTAQIDSFNEPVNGAKVVNGVGRSGRAQPIRNAPFYAVPTLPGITFTMGGILTDGRTRVLDVDDRPVPGLFAGGSTCGGLGGGYLGGFFPALTFGFVGGAEIAASLRAGQPVAVPA